MVVRNDNLEFEDKKIKKTLSQLIHDFFVLNWRIIVLLLLLIASLVFIWWSNAQVDNNFTNTFQ